MTNIATLIDKAIKYGCEGIEIFDGKTEEEIANAYNGIGAEWMSEEVRKSVTEHFSILEPAALIHDCQYAWLKDRDFLSWQESNEMFHRNCRRITKKKTSWYSPKRYKMFLAARAMFICVSTFGGWQAWKEATCALLEGDCLNVHKGNCNRV